ncbi:MAG: LytTR family DNA-binding domain-containing protein [Ekhidna sp.]
MKYRALIVEDEKKARNLLGKLISSECPDLEIIDEAESVQEAIEKIKASKPDIIFLDIQLGEERSFSILKEINHAEHKIIFVTAFEQYAVDAFRFSAVDYILKPVDPDLLVGAVERATQQLEDEDLKSNLDVLVHNLSEDDRKHKKLVLSTMDMVHLVELNEIIWCQSEGNYTNFGLINGNTLLISKTLKEYDAQLSGYGFMRVHKSYLVNLDHLSAFHKKEGGFLIMSDGAKIPVAVRKKEEFMKVFDRWK